MEFVSEHQVTGHDLDYCFHIAPSAFVRIAEGAFYFAQAKYGLFADHHVDGRSLTWMTASIKVQLHRVERTVEDLAGKLQIYADGMEIRGKVLTGYIKIYDKKGLLADCTVNTFTVDVSDRRIIDPRELAERCGVEFPIGDEPERVIVPKEMEFAESYPIRYMNCDYNRHLRGFLYSELAAENIELWTDPEISGLKEFFIEYTGECRPGEKLTVMKKYVGEKRFVTGIREDGRTSFRACYIPRRAET